MPTTNANKDLPYTGAFAITPHDTNELAVIPLAIYVGGAGNLSVKMGETIVTFIAPPVGSIIPVRPCVVRASLTTATNLIALY